jgi:adenine/guanine phosphoribosyltransferase-like PRPP-binding protein
MHPHDFWQRVEPPGTFGPLAAFSNLYPATFDDGRQLALPIRPLPDGERAVASLIINQASFAVVDAIAADLAAKLRPLAPDVVVGLPTLGLTLAAAVAQHLGHTRYVPLGTSRKFWYRDDLSVPLSSITSPDMAKQLAIDPRMLPLIANRRVVLIDDVISSGVSMAAGLQLLARCGCTPVAVAAAMLQSERWREPLAALPEEQIIASLRSPIFDRAPDRSWTPEAAS